MYDTDVSACQARKHIRSRCARGYWQHRPRCPALNTSEPRSTTARSMEIPCTLCTEQAHARISAYCDLECSRNAPASAMHTYCATAKSHPSQSTAKTRWQRHERWPRVRGVHLRSGGVWENGSGPISWQLQVGSEASRAPHGGVVKLHIDGCRCHKASRCWRSAAHPK